MGSQKKLEVLSRGLLKMRRPQACQDLWEKRPLMLPYPPTLPQCCLLLHREEILQRGCLPALGFQHVSPQWGPLQGERESWGLLCQGGLPCSCLPPSQEAPEPPLGMPTALLLEKGVLCSMEP